MASVEAVARRRHARAANSDRKRARREERERQAQVAQRMVTRFYGSMPPHLMMLGYLYWQARRCGWDAISPMWAKDKNGKPCDPTEGVAWKFWTRLHPETRQKIVNLSAFRLIRRR